MKSRLVLPFWYQLTWVVPEKGPLNRCVCLRETFYIVHKCGCRKTNVDYTKHTKKLSTLITSYLASTHTHTHPFNGPFSGTARVSRCQKGKTNLDFTEARDSEWQWHKLGHMHACISLQTDNHASTTPLVFYRPDDLPAAQPTASKHWRQLSIK